MTHVKALQAGHSSQGTSEPITPGLKGIWGYRGTLSDITKDTVFVQWRIDKIVL